MPLRPGNLRADSSALSTSICPAISAPFCAPLVAQQARELAGVDVGDRDDAARPQPFRQRHLAAPAARPPRHVAHDQPRGPGLRGLVVLLGAAGVADMRIGQRDDLPRIGRIGQDLLVAGHGGVEYHLADAQAGRTDGNAFEDGAVFERKDCSFCHGLRLGTSGDASSPNAGCSEARTRYWTGPCWREAGERE